ncbi:hypothetical protein VTN00DRAFT_5255 [Thermoascus crustaceus]|uniref:uncharacterized protein n=1 Tax=Thermoascus crustaceus TaxID=5088 RepID=UPI0037441311
MDKKPARKHGRAAQRSTSTWKDEKWSRIKVETSRGSANQDCWDARMGETQRSGPRELHVETTGEPQRAWGFMAAMIGAGLEVRSEMAGERGKTAMLGGGAGRRRRQPEDGQRHHRRLRSIRIDKGSTGSRVSTCRGPIEAFCALYDIACQGPSLRRILCL